MVECKWAVHACSSESELHSAANLLREELYVMWQTREPCDEAWVVLEPHPPTAFDKVDLVNAGSALVEIYGLRVHNHDDHSHENDGFEMLLPAQQIMTVRDLVHKSNRYRSFTYDVSHKLSPAAAQHRWRHIRIYCRQPLGTEEHKAPIGLTRVKVYPCKSEEEIGTESAEAVAEKQKQRQLDEMFPTAIRVGERIVSQVTEPRNYPGVQFQSMQEESDAFPGNQAVSNSKEKKRALPVWLSSDVRKQGSEDLVEKKGSEALVEKQAHGKNGGAGSKGSVEGLKTKGKALAPKEDNKESKPNFDAKSPESSRKVKCNNSSKSTETTDHKVHAHESQKSKLSFHGNKDKKVKDEGLKRWQSEDAETEAQIGKSRKNNSDSEEGFEITVGPRKEESSTLMNMNANNQAEIKQIRTSKTHRLFSHLLEGVIFSISGLVNPERAELRMKALEMGAEYRPDWCSDCTLLLCVFPNTPKFKQVKGLNGTIVSKDWILECHRQKDLVEIDPYLFYAGKPWRHIAPNVSEVKEELDEEQEQLPSSNEGHIYHKNPAKRCMKNFSSVADIQKWAYEDRAASIRWLQQQDQQPEAEEIETIACEGIILCLEDIIKGLNQSKSVKNVIESWGFVPRAAKEILAHEDGKSDAKGHSADDLTRAAERLKSIYEDEFKKIEEEQQKNESANEQPVKKMEKEKNSDDDDDYDDDATEIMSDEERDALDFESDETEVMDDGCIWQAEQKILFEFRG